MCIIIAIYTQEAATFNILGIGAQRRGDTSVTVPFGAAIRATPKKKLPSVQSRNERFVGEPRIFTPVSTCGLGSSSSSEAPVRTAATPMHNGAIKPPGCAARLRARPRGRQRLFKFVITDKRNDGLKPQFIVSLEGAAPALPLGVLRAAECHRATG